MDPKSRWTASPLPGAGVELGLATFSGMHKGIRRAQIRVERILRSVCHRMSKTILPSAKILVVDDEPSNVRLLERMLDLFGGLEYRCTTDPREAVSIFAEFEPDLVLTDLHMPHLDGYQLMARFRQLIPEDSFL